MKSIARPWAALSCLALVGFVARVQAQGTFANFETPQVNPITIATVGGDAPIDLVLICNAPDNSVEIYRAAPPHEFVQRVPVGLGPATVRWVPEKQRFYTCNFDGDSVSAVRIDVTHGGDIHAALERTSWVGDQPSDIAVDVDSGTAVVTLSGRSSTRTVALADLSWIGGEVVLEGDEPAIAPLLLAVKAPRQIEWLADGRIFVQNFMGESPDPNTTLPTQYDLDLWFFDPAFTGNVGKVEGLGSTNHKFAITSNGEVMVVVGTKARNHDAVGEVAVSGLQFGFVESRMWIVDIPPGQQPTVRAEAASGAPPVAITPLGRNLNRDYTALAPTEVLPKSALSQPTDVLVLEDESGEIATIVLTAFHSDKLTILTPALVAGGYKEQQVAIPVLDPTAGYTTSGPRGLAYSAETGLVYVACRLDSTLRVVDPASGMITASIQLDNDPTPEVVRQGRVFLYNATETSGSGFVSCASCHVDAATDGLDWDLGVVEAGPPIPPGLLGSGSPGLFEEWPSEKGPLITQTLQGLVNYPVGAATQYLFTNAPYHWRGDRADFQAFNVAFVGLLGRESELEDEEMDAYTAFINTVRHPPNPEQALDRVVPGFLDPDDPDDPSLASGAKLGLQIYHNAPTDGPRGCLGCHSLPEGSDNTLTDAFNVAKTITGGPAEAHPFETAALRNLVPREMFLHRAPGIQEPLWVVANVGTFHDGNPAAGSINFFNNLFFSSTVPGSTPEEMQTNLEALTEYTREFDWSMAPLAALAYTLDPDDPDANTTAFDFFEASVHEANSGLAVIARAGTTLRGFWYDITVSPPAYREEGTSTWLTQAEIRDLALLRDSAVVLQGAPPGNDRRIANPGGTATLIVDEEAPPANIEPAPMAPMTYTTDIPLFKQQLNIDESVSPPVVTVNPITTLWAVRTLQLSVLGNFGVDELHHEPPRRMRVFGDNIRPGGKLLVAIPTTTPASFPAQVMQLDLYPTLHFTDDGKQIWESEQELDPLVQFMLLNGGPFAPDVANVALRQTTTPSLDPLTWNFFAFAVLNEDSTINASFPFVPLTVQNTR